ncbi:hypothetical protein B0H11DRAFT_1920566 [Mycena galericulata]|nr:hypothetical protein B0H11DRAFT_1920566 [Mycena galericulata]
MPAYGLGPQTTPQLVQDVLVQHAAPSRTVRYLSNTWIRKRKIEAMKVDKETNPGALPNFLVEVSLTSARGTADSPSSSSNTTMRQIKECNKERFVPTPSQRHQEKMHVGVLVAPSSASSQGSGVDKSLRWKNPVATPLKPGSAQQIWHRLSKEVETTHRKDERTHNSPIFGASTRTKEIQPSENPGAGDIGRYRQDFVYLNWTDSCKERVGTIGARLILTANRKSLTQMGKKRDAELNPGWPSPEWNEVLLRLSIFQNDMHMPMWLNPSTRYLVLGVVTYSSKGIAGYSSARHVIGRGELEATIPGEQSPQLRGGRAGRGKKPKSSVNGT